MIRRGRFSGGIISGVSLLGRSTSCPSPAAALLWRMRFAQRPLERVEELRAFDIVSVVRSFSPAETAASGIVSGWSCRSTYAETPNRQHALDVAGARPEAQAVQDVQGCFARRERGHGGGARSACTRRLPRQVESATAGRAARRDRVAGFGVSCVTSGD